MSVEDCFWIITPGKAILTADVDTPELTEAWMNWIKINIFIFD
jgi:hypothetical protein